LTIKWGSKKQKQRVCKKRRDKGGRPLKKRPFGRIIREKMTVGGKKTQITIHGAGAKGNGAEATKEKGPIRSKGGIAVKRRRSGGEGKSLAMSGGKERNLILK